MPIDHFFNEPGDINISSAALEMAKAFLANARKREPAGDWVVTFDWALSRRVREPGTNVWHDLGAGPDLACYLRQNVPPSAIMRTEGIDFAVKIPAEVLAQHPEKLIDFDARGPGRIVLR